MSHISTDTRWMSEGNCAEKDPAIFFPSDGVGVEKAKRICNGCGFQNQCLEYALINRVEHGVWGGASERQRRRILKARRQLALTETSVKVS
ncbi:MAG: WhiB family transcriptional regulator [Acidimicrobiales bacterium]|jgi:WhiB family redox-sensing transcriptional regulator|nr:WhiB family transcriptional regulator [Acidimicrobiales bacterium]